MHQYCFPEIEKILAPEPSESERRKVVYREGMPAVVSVNYQSHLSTSGRVNLGSFYTPAKYVELVAEWLEAHGVDASWTIADLSCGYGAFFELAAMPDFAGCRFVGNDIDSNAIACARTKFPQVEFSEGNAQKQTI